MPKNQLKEYLVYSGIAAQMGITIWLFSKLGDWLAIVCNIPVLKTVLSLTGVFLALSVVLIKVIKDSKD
ncbi:MAG: hypothetical protein HRT66_09465 [Flavobacteriaceae bacterium]|nr:hypothetical protein [Flavobacteriaceae bacterium]